MSFSLWLLVLGCILLTLGLASAYLRLLPVSTSFIYLLFGLAIGPAGLHAWRSGLADISGWFEHLSEAALLISLFIGGLKLRLPLRSPAWTAAWLLAGPVLLGCILGLTLGAHFLFGLDWGLALLVAAILAPTDPVLASDIQVNHAGDDDRLRYAVSGEAGLNDGIAFPFVIAALLLIGQGGGLPGVRPQRPGLAAARRALGDSARPAGGLLPGPWSRPPGHPPAGAAHRHLGVGQRLPRPGADRAVLCRRRRTGRLGLPRQLRRRDRPAPRRGGDAGARLGTGRGAGGRRRRARGRAGQRRHRVRRRPQRTPEGGGRRGDARRALLRQPAGALAGSAAGDPARRHALPALGLARCRWRCCCSACAGRRWSGCWSAGG